MSCCVVGKIWMIDGNGQKRNARRCANVTFVRTIEKLKHSCIIYSLSTNIWLSILNSFSPQTQKSWAINPMSWSTLVEEGSGLNDDSHSNLKRFESEEAVLHGLRSSYNAAMSEVGSNSVGSPLWIRAMDLLKKVSIDCCSCMERIPSAAMQRFFR